MDGQARPFGVGGTQHLDQGIVDDLDDHLARRDGSQDVLADGLFLDAVDEVLDHGQGDVGLQQGDADFAQRCLDVGFLQGAASFQAVENAGQAFA